MEDKGFKLDFIGIGAPKSGTTWASKCLSEHPEICMSQPKEVHFFNKKYAFYRVGETFKYSKGISWYSSHWNHCNQSQKRGEWGVYYLQDEEAPKLIHKHFPNIKLVAILRDPVERLHSHYLHPAQNRNLPPFEEIIKTDKDFVEQSCYHKHLSRYLSFFPKENILILIYEDIKKDPLAFIQKIYKFLEVDDSFVPPSLHKKVSPLTGKFKFIKGKKQKKVVVVLEKLRLKNFIKKMVLFFMGNKKTPILSSEIKNELYKTYLPDIENLEKLIDRDLSIWKP